jgi:hypothetical protein
MNIFTYIKMKLQEYVVWAESNITTKRIFK